MTHGERAATVRRNKEEATPHCLSAPFFHFLLALFIPSFIREILNTYCGPGTVLGSGNIKIDTTQLCFCGT